MSQVAFNNKILIEPQGAWMFRVGTPAKASPAASGRVAIIGPADAGRYAHGSSNGDTEIPWYYNSQDVRDEFKQGVGVTCSDLVFHPSPTYAGASAVAFLRAQKATASSAQVKVSDGTTPAVGITLQAKGKGTFGNAYRVKAEHGTKPYKAYRNSSSVANTMGHAVETPAAAYAANKYAIKCTSLKQIANFYDGCTVTVIKASDDANSGFSSRVVSYDYTNYTLILADPLPTLAAKDDVFVIEKEIVCVTTTKGSALSLVTSTDYVTEPTGTGANGFWAPNAGNTTAPNACVVLPDGNIRAVQSVAAVGSVVTITLVGENLLLANYDQGVTFTMRTGIGGGAVTNVSATSNTLYVNWNTANASSYLIGHASNVEIAVDYVVRVRTNGSKEYCAIVSADANKITTIDKFYNAAGAEEIPSVDNTIGWYIVRAKNITLHYDADGDGLADSTETYESCNDVTYPGEAKVWFDQYSTLVDCTITAASDGVAFSTTCTNGDASTTVGRGIYVNLSGGTAPAMDLNDVNYCLNLIISEDVQQVFICSESLTFHAAGMAHCIADAETPRVLYCGGSLGMTRQQAKDRSIALNSERAVNCWPGVYITDPTTNDIALASPMYFAALVCGLRAGTPPELPLTRKAIACFGFEENQYSPRRRGEREDLISYGVLYGCYKKGLGYVVNAGVNTIQKNKSLWNYIERTSPEISLVSARDQIFRELSEGLENFAVGGNLTIITPALVKSFMENTLNGFVSRNLIVGWGNLLITQQDDYYLVSFTFNGNNPINFMLAVGTVVS